MTHKEKAEELFDKMYMTGIDEYNCKQCALIAVDELIYETQFEVPNIRQRYWIEVKKEIENL
jgi:hypothetical protein